MFAAERPCFDGTKDFRRTLSEALGHAKPSAQYFEQALRRLALPGDSVLFLDDRELNVAAARSVGLHAELAQIDHGAAGMRQLLSRYGLPVA